MPSPNWVLEALQRLSDDTRIGETLVAQALGQVMRGDATPAQVGALLAGMRIQGETADEIAGAVRALRAAMLPVDIAGLEHVVDTAGTGGGTVTTFNISTAAAVVVAAAGAVVAKHGNRSSTSKCGSSDVVEALGMKLATDPEVAATELRRVGIAFLFAPAFHPAMRHVAPIRRELGIPTLMNIVGPLSNPAGVTRQLVGVADPERAPLMAEVLARLGAEHAMVVHGYAGLDEISPVGPTAFWEVRSGTVEQGEFRPETLGLPAVDIGELAGGDSAANARRIERLLSEPLSDPSGRVAVGLNGGAALYVAGVTESVADGVETALAALDDGRAADLLRRARS